MPAPACTLTTVIHTITTVRETFVLTGRLAAIVLELWEHREDVERWQKVRFTVNCAGDDTVKLRDWAGNDE